MVKGKHKKLVFKEIAKFLIFQKNNWFKQFLLQTKCVISCVWCALIDKYSLTVDPGRKYIAKNRVRKMMMGLAFILENYPCLCKSIILVKELERVALLGQDFPMVKVRGGVLIQY